MKLLGVVFVAFLVAPLCAQYRSVGGFGSVTFPALGHAPAGPNPWGNVTFPAIPQGSAAFSPAFRNAGNRYGSLVNGFGSYRAEGRDHHRRASGIYAYPVFIGGFGYGGYGPEPQAPPPDAGATNGPAAPPVIINQYFGSAPPDQGPPPPDTASGSNFHYYQSPAANETVAPGEPSYYLIAFKDHTIYSAVAYYTEGDTLHYFTSGNVHNQVSLSLVDRQLTEQLNRERNVAVRLP